MLTSSCSSAVVLLVVAVVPCINSTLVPAVPSPADIVMLKSHCSACSGTSTDAGLTREALRDNVSIVVIIT